MKIRRLSLIFVLLLAFSILGGCGMAGAEQTTANTENPTTATTEVKTQTATEWTAQASVGDTVQKPEDTASATEAGTQTSPVLTALEAEDIALKHAGFTKDQVKSLRTEYEVEHGIPHYEVEFNQDMWEYDYKIHADTGEVLSFSKDD